MDIIKCQEEYIEKFLKSKWGKLYIFHRNTKTDNNFVSDEYETNCDMIRKINTWKVFLTYKCLRQKIQYFIFRINMYGKIKIQNKSIVKKTKTDYFAIAVIVKNESKNILEWVEFHFKMGVDRIFLFDNESDDDTKIILKQYIDSGKIIYIYFPGKIAQLHAYNYACKLYKGKWLALIDADEFLFSLKEKLPKFMKNYEEYPALGVNWVVYGPSGHENRPDGLICNNYNETFENKNHEMNCAIKSIVQPKKVRQCLHVHYCVYKKSKFAVDEDFNMIYGQSGNCAKTNKNSVDKIRINHYWTKSVEDLRGKCNRGYPDGTKNPEFEKIMKIFDERMVIDETIKQVL